jgi:hypothetical protein
MSSCALSSRSPTALPPSPRPSPPLSLLLTLHSSLETIVYFVGARSSLSTPASLPPLSSISSLSLPPLPHGTSRWQPMLLHTLCAHWRPCVANVLLTCCCTRCAHPGDHGSRLHTLAHSLSCSLQPTQGVRQGVQVFACAMVLGVRLTPCLAHCTSRTLSLFYTHTVVCALCVQHTMCTAHTPKGRDTAVSRTSRVHLGTLGYTWVHLGTREYTRVHASTLGYKQTHTCTHDNTGARHAHMLDQVLR